MDHSNIDENKNINFLIKNRDNDNIIKKLSGNKGDNSNKNNNSNDNSNKYNNHDENNESNIDDSVINNVNKIHQYREEKAFNIITDKISRNEKINRNDDDDYADDDDDDDDNIEFKRGMRDEDSNLPYRRNKEEEEKEKEQQQQQQQQQLQLQQLINQIQTQTQTQIELNHHVSHLLASTIKTSSNQKLKLKLRAPSSDERLQWVTWFQRVIEVNNIP